MLFILYVFCSSILRTRLALVKKVYRRRMPHGGRISRFTTRTGSECQLYRVYRTSPMSTFIPEQRPCDRRSQNNQALPPSDRPHYGPGFKLDHSVDGQVGSIHLIIIQPQVDLFNQPFLPLSTLFSTTATAESAISVNAPIRTAAVEDIASSFSLGPQGVMHIYLLISPVCLYNLMLGS